MRPEYCITLLRILLRFGVNWVGKRCLRSWRGFSPMMRLLPTPLAFGNRWNRPAIGAGHYHTTNAYRIGKSPQAIGSYLT